MTDFNQVVPFKKLKSKKNSPASGKLMVLAKSMKPSSTKGKIMVQTQKTLNGEDIRRSTRSSLTNAKKQMTRVVMDAKLQPHDVPFLIIPSESKFRLVWDLSMLIILCFILVTTPYYFGFNSEPSEFEIILEQIIEIFFIFDIIINFRTGFYAKGDVREIFDSKQICKNYIQTWFIADLVSSIPTGLLVIILPPAAGEVLGKANKLLKGFKILRLAKLIRFLNISKYIDIVDQHFAVTRNALQMIKLLLSAVLLSHTNACVFYYISTISCAEDISLSTCSKLVNMESKPISERYLHAFYWSVTTLTTIGYGDITPVSLHERIYCVCVMLLGSGFYGYVIASMAYHVNKFDINKQLYNDRMDHLKSYMNCRRLPNDLQRRVKMYYKHYLSQKTALNENEILGELSTVLRHEIVAHLVHDAVFHNRLFKNQEPHLLSQMITILKPQTCGVGDIIIKQNEVGRDMYILIRGEMDVYHNDLLIRNIIDGASFGELAALDIDSSRRVTVMAKTHCELYSISKEDLMSAFKGHPEELSKMRAVAKMHSIDKEQRVKQAFNKVRRVCAKNRLMSIARVTLLMKKKDDVEKPEDKANPFIKFIGDLNRSQKVVDDFKDFLICVTCHNRPRNTVFINCKHVVCCGVCSKLHSKCPSCDAQVGGNTLLIIYPSSEETQKNLVNNLGDIDKDYHP